MAHITFSLLADCDSAPYLRPLGAWDITAAPLWIPSLISRRRRSEGRVRIRIALLFLNLLLRSGSGHWAHFIAHAEFLELSLANFWNQIILVFGGRGIFCALLFSSIFVLYPTGTKSILRVIKNKNVCKNYQMFPGHKTVSSWEL